MWRQVCAQVGVCEERRGRVVERPVRVLEAVEAVRVVGGQAAFVAQDGDVGGLHGDGAVDESVDLRDSCTSCVPRSLN